MRAKRILSLFLFLMVISSLFINTSHADAAPTGSTVQASSGTAYQLPEGAIKAGETDKIALYYTKDRFALFIQDKRNGYVWSSMVSKEQYGSEVNKIVENRISALLDFRYTNTKNTKQAIVSIDYGDNPPEISVLPVNNGINILYKFPKLGLTIPVNAVLEKNVLSVSIPVSGIKEESTFKIVTIDLMPYMGASTMSEQGYMFYPDGSGALFRFNNEPRRDINRYSFHIYGTDEVNLFNYYGSAWLNTKPIMLPVFGVKKGDNAFLAAITKGEYDTRVNFTPSGFTNIFINRISAEFTYRRTFNDLRNDPNIPPKIESEIMEIDREVKYFFLAGENADYSGMANEYRNYLVEKGDLVKKVNDGDKSIPLGLDLFMGIKEKRILFDKYVKATTFGQAETILEKLGGYGVNNIHVNLIGWGDQGYGRNPAIQPPSRKLGGEKGLKQLAEYVQSKGYKLFLSTNFSDAVKGVAGFSVRNDTVYQRNGLIVTDFSNHNFLLNPFAALRIFLKNFFNNVTKYGANGLSFERMGEQLYHDYNKNNPSSRQQTAQIWQQMLTETSSKLGQSGVNGGNAYVLKYADRLFNIPTEDSGVMSTYEAIPFYQMVVHGYIPYSSDPGNLFYDFDRQKLKWIEYGCIPYFKLTYSKSDILKYTGYSTLYSSYYEDWAELAADTWKEFNTRLGGIATEKMIKHEQPAEGVYKVTYEDGTRIYLNYNDNDVKLDGFNIKGVNYLVVDQRGNIR